MMINNKYDLSQFHDEKFDKNAYLSDFRHIYGKRSQYFESLLESYKSIFDDIYYFPVAESDISDDKKVRYENSWLAERLYGGKRGHEGCDIMAEYNKRGVYPIVSVSNGIVENIGWLDKGGYRIGIRSENGAYFYYAHLSDYAKKFNKGDRVKAGEIIGYMGDSGYGNEGTVGKFDVHLHFGIYIKTENYEELSVNPYWVLKLIEDKKIIYSF